MFGLQLGRLGISGSLFSESALWPQGASSPGLWIDPALVSSEFQDPAGTTALSAIGTVADSSNPVGLILDRKGNLALGAETLGAWATSGYWSLYVAGTTFPGNSIEFDAVSDRCARPTMMTAGKRYFVTGVLSITGGATFTIDDDGTTGGPGVTTQYLQTTVSGTFSGYILATSSVRIRLIQSTSGTISLTSFSVRELPGIHLSQSTSAARPVASARVNLLTYSEDFSNAVWATPALVSKTASSITELVVSNEHYTNQILTKAASAVPVIFSIKFKNGTGTRNFAIGLTDGTTGGWCSIFSTAGAVVASSQAIGSTTGWTFTAASISTADADGFYTASISLTTNTSTRLDAVVYLVNGTTRSYTGDGTSTIQVKQAQVNLGPTALSYQRVGAASDYTATGFPAYLKFDGTDDGLASATFSAGTLTSSMDCLIAVRRDAAGLAVVGLYDSSDITRWFAAPQAGSGSVCFDAAGTPTVWVDGVQLAGGTAVNRGTLDTALTVGRWHIMEFRGLDLSAWVKLCFGNYSGFPANCALGKILLFASGQDSNRDKARARMAAYFGVTLP